MASFKQGKIKYGFLETTTSSGTLVLTSSSLQYQILTGTANHTVVLPDATTLANNIAFNIINISTGTITVKLNDTTTTQLTLVSGTGALILVTDITTSNGIWDNKTGSTGSPGGVASAPPGSTKTSNYSILSTDNGKIINCDTTAGVVSITLPVPIAGFKVTIKDIGGFSAINNITVLQNSTETIDSVQASALILENNMAISFIADGTNWSRFDSFHRQLQNSGRGIFGGGNTGSLSSIIDYITISTASNATSFGNLTVARGAIGTCASLTRALFGGGDGPVNNIDYVTMATTSNAAAFGTLTTSRAGPGGVSSSTLGIFGSTTIDYVTIATLGNATTFGSLTVSRSTPGACSNPTRGVFLGGDNGPGATIDYVTIATIGNATSFGSLTQARQYPAACSNATRGVCAGGLLAGGSTSSNTIDYITIATTGNATSFGTLTSSRANPGACSSFTTGVWGGGLIYPGPSISGTIDYIAIATTGNATSFGSLSVARHAVASISSSHGGLNG